MEQVCALFGRKKNSETYLTCSIKFLKKNAETHLTCSIQVNIQKKITATFKRQIHLSTELKNHQNLLKMHVGWNGKKYWGIQWLYVVFQNQNNTHGENCK